MARAIRIHQTGGPDALEFDEVEVGEPGPNEARLRQTAIGVNFIDTYHRSGLYPVDDLPQGIGMEAAGVVKDLGDEVTEVEVGDRVAYAGGSPGAYAEERVMPADRLVPLPDDVDDQTAAAMMLQGMTVEYLVRRTFPVEPGHVVLWHAAAGGVGLIACQWLSYIGATVVGTVSTEEKAELASDHGCDYPVNYTEEDFVDRVMEVTDGRGADVVYDSVGKDTFDQSLDALGERGMLVAFGNASGAPEPFDPLELSRRGSLFLTRPRLGDYVATRDELLDSAAALFDLVERGFVEINVNQTWPLADAADAHRALEGRQTTGSTVLTVE